MVGFSYDALREVHLEPTTRCQLRCPMCPRTGKDGAPNRRVPRADLSAAAVEEILPGTLLGRLDQVVLCGNYGDPMWAPELLQMVTWMRKGRRRLRIVMHTNGSGQPADFWAEIARLKVRVRFGIDGLEASLGRYRRGADFGAVMASAEAFIAAGGKATWQLIRFAHNADEVEAARARAEAMGFARFVVKDTQRFFKARYYPRTPDGQRDYTGVPRLPVYAGQAVVDHLAPPPDALGPPRRSFRKSRDAGSIRCRVLDDQSVYVSAGRLVFPCCWLGEIYAQDRAARAGQLTELLGADGWEALRSPETSLRDIVEGPVFGAIAARMRCQTVAAGRLETCARTCAVASDTDGGPGSTAGR